MAPVRQPAFTQTVLPGFDWKGAPWHGGDSIDPHPLGGGKFEIVTQVETDCETLHPLPLEAFVVRKDQDLVFRGSLRIEGFEFEKPRFRREVQGDRVRIQNVYSLPDPIRPGSYRILVRAGNAYDFFCPFQGSKNHLCDMPDGAASRWIPFEVH